MYIKYVVKRSLFVGCVLLSSIIFGNEESNLGMERKKIHLEPIKFHQGTHSFANSGDFNGEGDRRKDGFRQFYNPWPLRLILEVNCKDIDRLYGEISFIDLSSNKMTKYNLSNETKSHTVIKNPPECYHSIWLEPLPEGDYEFTFDLYSDHNPIGIINVNLSKYLRN